MSAPPPPPPSFFEELKRRKVVRVALVYGAVAFAVLQAADIVVPALELPGWFLSGLVTLTLLGFPLALVLAWAFEVTPEGVRRTEGVGDGDGVLADAGTARTGWVGARTVVAVVGLLVMGWLAGSWASGGGGGDEAATGGADGLDRLKVAVLPFRNAAQDDESALIVAGLHDDILTRLSRIGALRIVSRTSVMAYDPEQQHNIREIARELGAGTIIEGSVQRAGNALRVNVQLIDGANDEHLWGENYDETWSMENLFSIQSRIAESVAGRLEAELTPEERVAVEARPTDVEEAWERYHAGMELWISAGRSTLPETVDLFRAAAEADPEFVDAWSMLGRAHLFTYWTRVDPSTTRRDSARLALDRARALDPDHPSVFLTEAHHHYWGFLDYAEALAAFRRAEELGAPGGMELQGGVASVYRRMGRTEEALAEFRDAVELDPLNPLAHFSVGETALLLRRYADARAALATALRLAPDYDWAHAVSAWLELMQSGDVEAARAALTEGLRRNPQAIDLVGPAALIDLVAGEPQRLLERLPEDSSPEIAYDDQYHFWPAALLRGMARQDLGDETGARAEYEAALRMLEEARAARSYDERVPSAMGLAHAGLGRRDEALEAGRLGMEMLALEDEAWRGATRLEEMALIHAMLGEAEPAVELLGRLLEHPFGISVELIRIDRRWDPIREDPAFQALLEG